MGGMPEAARRVLRARRHCCHGTGICDSLKRLLTDTAAEVDREFPHHAADVTISPGGEPTVKRTTAKEIPASAVALHTTIGNRVAPRDLLDILLNINHWTDFTRHFGPLSGDDARLRNARARYLLTTFSLAQAWASTRRPDIWPTRCRLTNFRMPTGTTWAWSSWTPRTGT